jgi:hypothetical protein
MTTPDDPKDEERRSRIGGIRRRFEAAVVGEPAVGRALVFDDLPWLLEVVRDLMIERNAALGTVALLVRRTCADNERAVKAEELAAAARKNELHWLARRDAAIEAREEIDARLRDAVAALRLCEHAALMAEALLIRPAAIEDAKRAREAARRAISADDAARRPTGERKAQDPPADG